MPTWLPARPLSRPVSTALTTSKGGALSWKSGGRCFAAFDPLIRNKPVAAFCGHASYRVGYTHWDIPLQDRATNDPDEKIFVTWCVRIVTYPADNVAFQS